MKHETLVDGLVDIYQGDCAKCTLPSDWMDLTVTSPPYDNLRDYNGYVFDFETIANELYRITKPGGVVVWVVGDATIDGSETGTSFRQALHFMDIGFRLHDTMIYYRSAPPLTHNRYEQHFEYMFIFSKNTPNTFNPIKTAKQWKDNRKTKKIRREKDGSFDIGFVGKNEYKIKGNVWKISAGGGHTHSENYTIDHPAIFPEALARDHILSWSNPGDVVYDPMMGSGTTGKMAVKFDRKFIGCEISDEYYQIARRRIKETLMQPKLFSEIRKE